MMTETLAVLAQSALLVILNGLDWHSAETVRSTPASSSATTDRVPHNDRY